MNHAHESFEAGMRALRHRRPRDAARFFEAAERFGYARNTCAAALWECAMLDGDFESAWQQSDRIEAMGLPDANRYWKGESWDGRRVIIRGLHGLGDTIQFVRYAPLIRRTARSLVVQVHPQLVRLIECVDGIDRVITWEQPEGEWDVQLEITELPRAFRTTHDSIPSQVPYVHIPRQEIERAAAWIGNSPHPRIGVNRQSGEWNPARSIPIEALQPLFHGHHFHNLQKNGCEIDGLCDLEVFASDVRDTAAAMMHLDLVITVDTMTAHLAGALGKPVWIMLPFEADWRWMLHRCDSPWYPTARLFRQRQPGDWDSVLSRIAVAIKAL